MSSPRPFWLVPVMPRDSSENRWASIRCKMIGPVPSPSAGGGARSLFRFLFRFLRRLRRDPMQLDRFTEKAQEAIVTAQQLAERAQSPVLDAEHILAALLEDPEGIPAATLRALKADPNQIAMDLGVALSRRARVCASADSQSRAAIVPPAARCSLKRRRSHRTSPCRVRSVCFTPMLGRKWRS